MLNSLYKFLVLNDHVSIPGVGTFSVQRTPAFFDRGFQPPKENIHFTAGTALAEKKFYDYLAADHGYSEVDAVRKFQDFAYNLKKQIQSHDFVELSGLGMLKKNQVGEIVFDAAESNNYFPVIKPSEIERQQTIPAAEASVAQEPHSIAEEAIDEEEVIAKDRWWIWATVLAMLALAAIGYFYMTEM